MAVTKKPKKVFDIAAYLAEFDGKTLTDPEWRMVVATKLVYNPQDVPGLWTLDILNEAARRDWFTIAGDQYTLKILTGLNPPTASATTHVSTQLEMKW